MFDFGGWWFNWEWDGSLIGGPSRGGVAVSLALGAVGVGLLATAFGTGPGAGAWGAVAAGAVVGVALTAVGAIEALLEERAAFAFVLGDTLALAGVAARVARAAGGSPALASCAAMVSLALLWRAWGATWFSLLLAADNDALERKVRAARAGAAGAALLRLTRREAGRAEAVIEAEGGEVTVFVREAVFGRSSGARHAQEDLWLLEEPRWEEAVVHGEGYRATAVERTIVGAAGVHVVPAPGGFEVRREGWREEVRAGAVVLAGLHLVVVALALIPLR